MASRILQKGKNRITQGYGAGHKAIDLGREHLTGEPVIAHTAGKVVFCQTGHKNNKGATGNASYGNCVKIDHGHGYSTLYAHLATVKVKNGEKVKQGQVIGTMGNTGNSYGMHLHFEVRLDNKRIDPMPYLEADLPLPKDDKIHVTYKAYAGKWWADIVDCHDDSTNGYAGVRGRNLTAFTAKAAKGTLRYRAHLLNGGWLSWMSTSDINRPKTGYAGIKGKAMDAVQMELNGLPDYEVHYRVAPKGGDWYAWNTVVFGQAIDRLQIKIVKKEA
ncbi:MAG: M23 family metallopeptidase [Clostridia bacterium]|nr:M23 family metallopeptidase [Clostridia bacterium]